MTIIVFRYCLFLALSKVASGFRHWRWTKWSSPARRENGNNVRSRQHGWIRGRSFCCSARLTELGESFFGLKFLHFVIVGEEV
jgi:hypothetical protein